MPARELATPPVRKQVDAVLRLEDRFIEPEPGQGNQSVTTLLKLTGISKSFAGVQALKGVSFDLRAGEVHALVGENGAGKSTLIKVITGAHQPDEGTLEVQGQPVERQRPGRAPATLGIAAIYQQPALFPDLTVAENIALGLEPGGAWRRVRWGERRDAGAAAARPDRRGDRPRDATSAGCRCPSSSSSRSPGPSGPTPGS